MQLPFSLAADTEFDAAALFATAMDAAVQSLLVAARERPDITVELVGASVFAVTIVCLDSDMKPLWNACSYADKRTFAFAEAQRAQMQPEQLQHLSAPIAFPPPMPRNPAHSRILAKTLTYPPPPPSLPLHQLRLYRHPRRLSLRPRPHPAPARIQIPSRMVTVTRHPIASARVFIRPQVISSPRVHSR